MGLFSILFSLSILNSLSLRFYFYFHILLILLSLSRLFLSLLSHSLTSFRVLARVNFDIEFNFDSNLPSSKLNLISTLRSHVQSFISFLSSNLTSGSPSRLLALRILSSDTPAHLYVVGCVRPRVLSRAVGPFVSPSVRKSVIFEFAEMRLISLLEDASLAMLSHDS